MTLVPFAPVLETENLIIRAPEKGDADHVIRFLMDPIRSAGFGGEDNRGDAWRWFTLNVGHWHWHGYGYFTVVDRASGQPCGICGIWNPEGWPEPEIGWVVFDGFEGRGVAFEAAQRVRRYAYEDLKLATLTSNIVPSNERSKRLAARLGAVYERTYVNVAMGEDELWRHPGPEAVL
ncbi:GNAT family N-acetyltransferase [Sagittula sp. SSi028]|uniref:GNAT family N-acetyltransferase n=1 Tax=Sagittula sp. SSi028 TaxID=3400636 RepID=UPI003AF63AD5